MTEQLELASRLQAYDQHIAQLQKEIAALPKHIAQIEKALDAHLRRLEADRAALAANLRDRKRLEDDVKVNEQKISKLKDQMLQAKTNEQYRAFQHEIEFCEKEIRRAEDKILDLMGESEPLDQNVKKAEAALAQEKKTVEGEKAQARERTAKDEAELKRLRDEREQALGALTPEVRSAYERIRKKWNGTVLAEATDGRCGACYIALRPQLFQELRKGDKLVFCESCGRFLFYNPPVAVDLSGNAQAAPRD